MKYFYILETTCSGDITTCCGDYAIAKYVVIIQKVLGIIQFVVPIILILMATIGLIKLMLNPDDPQRKSWKSLTNKFLAAVIVFFIPIIGNALFKLIPNSFDISGCFNKAEQTANSIDSTEEYTANNYNYTKAKDELDKIKSENRVCPGLQKKKCKKEEKQKFEDYVEYLQKIVNGENYQYLNYYDYETHGEVKMSSSSSSGINIVASNKTYASENSSTSSGTVERNSKSTSEKNSSKSTSKKGEDVVKYAKKFIGNPYVYGGTSLTNGTDCSGFVMSVYNHFGISLPRTAAQQAASSKGKTIKSISDAQPGDLLFYKDKSGGIGHVTMYEGNGKVVHASSSTTGIIESNVNYRSYSLIKRFL